VLAAGGADWLPTLCVALGEVDGLALTAAMPDWLGDDGMFGSEPRPGGGGGFDTRSAATAEGCVTARIDPDGVAGGGGGAGGAETLEPEGACADAGSGGGTERGGAGIAASLIGGNIGFGATPTSVFFRPSPGCGLAAT